jgi:hypothetical protein
MRANPKVRANYEGEFKVAVKGYYQDNFGGLVNVNVPITDEDKNIILSQVFNNQIKGNFDLDFPESIYP